MSRTQIGFSMLCNLLFVKRKRIRCCTERNDFEDGKIDTSGGADEHDGTGEEMLRDPTAHGHNVLHLRGASQGWLSSGPADTSQVERDGGEAFGSKTVRHTTHKLLASTHFGVLVHQHHNDGLLHHVGSGFENPHR